MRERGLEFKVGLLILVSSAILVGVHLRPRQLLAALGLHDLRRLRLHRQPAAGAPVKVSGIKVGKVEDVEFLGGKADPTSSAASACRCGVTAWIEDRVRDSIRSDAEFFINTAGVLGEQYLEIVPGHDWDKPPIAADAIIHGAPAVHDPPRTDLVVARLYEVLDGVAERAARRSRRDQEPAVEQRERGRRGERAARRQPRAASAS